MRRYTDLEDIRRPGRPRLWVEAAARDETASSVLDRAAVFYRTDIVTIALYVAPSHRGWTYLPDFDRSDELKRGLVAALPAPEHIQDCDVPSESVTPLNRAAYCPLCFRDWLREGRSPYFKWQWAVMYVTLCEVHASPLCVWRQMRRQHRVLPRSWIVRPSLAVAGDCPWLEGDARFALKAQDYLADDRWPLSVVWHYQQRAFNLVGTSRQYRDPRNPELVGLDRALQAGAYRTTPVAEAPASRDCPITRLPGLFSKQPPDDLCRAERSVVRGIRAQKSVGWRRTLMWFVASLLASPSLRGSRAGASRRT